MFHTCLYTINVYVCMPFSSNWAYHPLGYQLIWWEIPAYDAWDTSKCFIAGSRYSVLFASFCIFVWSWKWGIPLNHAIEKLDTKIRFWMILGTRFSDKSILPQNSKEANNHSPQYHSFLEYCNHFILALKKTDTQLDSLLLAALFYLASSEMHIMEFRSANQSQPTGKLT